MKTQSKCSLSEDHLSILIQNTQDKIILIKESAQAEFAIMEDARTYLKQAQEDFSAKEALYLEKTKDMDSQQQLLDELVKMRDGNPEAFAYKKLDNNVVKPERKYRHTGIRWRTEAEAILREKKQFFAIDDLFAAILRKHPEKAPKVNPNAKYVFNRDMRLQAKQHTTFVLDKEGQIGIGKWLKKNGDHSEAYLMAKHGVRA